MVDADVEFKYKILPLSTLSANIARFLDSENVIMIISESARGNTGGAKSNTLIMLSSNKQNTILKYILVTFYLPRDLILNYHGPFSGN
jgi:hypothetical protein